jgi:hypothetical protein
MKVIRLTESDIENLVKKIIKEEVSVPNTDGYNFQYDGPNGRKASYITEEIIDEEVSTVMGRDGDYKTMTIRIALNKYGKEGRGDASIKANLGSRLFYHYNNQTSKGRLSFVYNFDGGKDFFKVVPPHFHTPFKKLVTQLNEYSRTKIAESEPKEDPKKKGMFGRMFGESRIDEIGGYDSPELGAHHSKSTMEEVLRIFTNISDEFSKLNTMQFDILDDKLSKETRIMLQNIQPILERYGKAWTSAEKRRLS